MNRERIIDLFLALPEVQAGVGCFQNEFHQFDVFEHTLKFVEEIQKDTEDLDLIVAGILHDIGKPVVAVPRCYNGEMQFDRDGHQYHDFNDHEVVGEEMVRKMAKNIFLEAGLDQERIAKLVGAHFLPMLGIKKIRRTENYSDYLKCFEKLDDDLEKVGIGKEDILRMFLADLVAKGDAPDDIGELDAIRMALLAEGYDRKELLRLIYFIQIEAHYEDRSRYAEKE